MLTVSIDWQNQNPPAQVGILVLHQAANCLDHPALQESRQKLEIDLRTRYGDLDRKALRALPVFAAYDDFYRPFRKTYHVQLQLESVVFQGKPILSPSALVGAMFMAELSTGLLTAAHDLAVLALPLTAELARGDETYLRMGGAEQTLKAGDLTIRDQQGVLSSVIYGPDQRTQVRAETDQVVYTTYAPPGISREQVLKELEILEKYIRLFAPQAQRELLAVF